ncbi:MAG: serine hydrolase domain-containing protein [Vicinamibacterales bacterium]|nr:serine hydrolase domain-containing protein [Vicinamibacterales bacterium]
MAPEPAARLLDEAVAAGAFPCAVAEAGAAAGPRWQHVTGRLSWDAGAPAAQAGTVFDLASLTKVLATTTIAMRLLEAGHLDLEDAVRTRIPAWRGEDRRAATIADLLSHASGLPGHRPYFRTMSGRAAFVDAICAEPLDAPPRTRAAYSDLGFILLGTLLEDAAGETLDRQFARFWSDALPGTPAPTYGVAAAARAQVAPTERDPWRGRVLQGEVHDENAFALGGVAAHAGLFGTAASVGAFARWLLGLLRGGTAGPVGISSATARRFAARGTVPGSSRALGWDTMLPTSSCGTRFSPAAIGHTGFTGTTLWLDPALDRYAVLLTNRVHPTRENDAIQTVRPAFHDAVLDQLS